MARRTRYPIPKGPMRSIKWVEPYGMCAHSGAMYPHSQLVKQYAQAGNSVYWTGLLVHPSHLDPLDDQLRIPHLPPADPPAVVNPRPLTTWENGGKDPNA